MTDTEIASIYSARTPVPAPPLPTGWTQNTAPSGHIYYYNAQTRESTYRRPGLPPGPPPPPTPRPSEQTGAPAPDSFLHSVPPPHNALLPVPFLRLSDPRVANAFIAQRNARSSADNGHSYSDHGRRTSSSFRRPRRQPTDKPRSLVPIPGCDPWVLVYTRYGRRFVYNPMKNASFWRIPEKLMPAVLELDKAGIRTQAQAHESEQKDRKPDITRDAAAGLLLQTMGLDSESEYEEVEVSEDDGHGETESGENQPKRLKTGQGEAETFGAAHMPIEFSEADIAYQLQAAAGELGSDYGQDDWEGEDDKEGEPDLSEEEAAALFRALLNDFQVNPFSSWENLIEEGKIFDDERYTALPTMKARRAVWEAWSRDSIRDRNAKKATESRNQDPRGEYLQLLQDHATPKLYWAEFKRKYRKEHAMKDVSVSDREKEKLFREFVARQKLPLSTLKADLSKLLDSLPRGVLNSQTDVRHPPLELASDLRYAALDPKVRSPLVEAYIKTVPPPTAGP